MGIQLSHSACERYLTSPRSYYLHYLLRIRPTELSSALLFGSAMDEGFNCLLEQKQKNELCDLESAMSVFSNSWNKCRDSDVKYSKADLDESLFTELDTTSEFNKSWLSLRRKGFMMLEAYAEQIIPRLKEVYLIQKNITLTNEAGDSFIGVVDLVAKWDNDCLYIFDNKTSSIKYKDNSADESAQLAVYQEALKDELNIEGVAYITIPKRIRKQKLPLVPIDVIFGTINEELLEETFNKYDKVLTGIKTAEFPCTPEGCCSKPWPCPYKNFCQSGDMTGLEFAEKSKK